MVDWLIEDTLSGVYYAFIGYSGIFHLINVTVTIYCVTVTLTEVIMENQNTHPEQSMGRRPIHDEAMSPAERRRARLRDATLCGFGALSAMGMAAVAPALPALAEHFADEPDIALRARLVLAMPTLLMALASPLVGAVADRFGRRNLLIFGALLYLVAGVVPWWLDSLDTILASRVVLGLANAILFTVAAALLGDFHTGPARNRMMAIYGVSGAGGGIGFVLAGGALAEFGWREPFLIYFVVLLLLPSLLAVVRDPVRSGDDAPAPADKSASRMPWLALFGIYAVIALTGGVFLQVPLNLPFMLVEMGGATPALVGVAIAWAMALQSVGGFAFPWLRRRFGSAVIYGGIAGGLAAGYALLSVADNVVMVFVALALFGLGMSQMFPNSSTWLLGITPGRVRARVLGGLTTSIYSGQLLSPFIAVPVMAALGLQATFAIIAMLMAAVMVMVPVTVALHRRRQSGRQVG